MRPEQVQDINNSNYVSVSVWSQLSNTMYSTLKRLAFGIWFPARGYRKNGLAKGISVGVLRLKFGIKLGAEVRNLRKVDVWQGQ
jgi:hypothetical protein